MGARELFIDLAKAVGTAHREALLVVHRRFVTSHLVNKATRLHEGANTVPAFDDEGEVVEDRGEPRGASLRGSFARTH